jgi:hypothetical protein
MPAMTVEAFKATLANSAAPAGQGRALTALWHAARGEWDTAHELAQTEKNLAGWWVHAYLHRVEGDLANADYWYKRAGTGRPEASLQEEWDAIATALLAR